MCGSVAAPLSALLADPAERCRERAAQLLTDAAGAMPEPDALLPLLSGVLAQRLQSGSKQASRL